MKRAPDTFAARTRVRLPRLSLLIGLLGVATPALAYLDPSTGSMILSAIIGMLATVGLALKTYWYRLKGLLRGRRPESRDPAGAAPAARNEPHPGSNERGHGRPAD